MSNLSFKGRQFQRTNYKREGSKSSQKETKKIKENVQYPNVCIQKVDSICSYHDSFGDVYNRNKQETLVQSYILI